MKTRSWTVGLTCVLALAGCKQNPFPEQGLITPVTPDPPRQVAPPYGLKVPARAIFEEGKPGSVSIQAWVPAPGSSRIQVVGLPAGAVFDSANLTINWTPSYSDGNDPADPTSTAREYPIQILLNNTADPTTSLSGETTLVVRDVPQTIQLVGASNSWMDENSATPFTQEIVIQSADFPNGPFQLNAAGLPAGAVLNRSPGSLIAFTLNYTPDSSVVRFAPGSARNSREFLIELTAVAPNQSKFVKQLKWTVRDTRNYPRISSPGEVTQGPDVNFTLTAEDLNGEVAPRVTLNTPVPFGRAVLTLLREDSPLPADRNPLTIMNVGWVDIPADRVGTRQSMSFNICVNKTLTQQTYCRVESVTINLQSVARLGAAFDRAAWPMGDTKIAQEGLPAQYVLPLSDLDRPVSVPNVVVQPAELAASGEVVWDATARKVIVTPHGAGSKQFNLVATSFYGVKQTESFVYDALPRTRSRILVLGESLQNPEVAALLKILPSGVQVVNPSLQPLAARDLAFRDAVIAGTSAFKDADSLTALDLAAGRIRNVILQTPLLGHLPTGLQAEVAALGATGHPLLDLANPPAPGLAVLHLFLDRGPGAVPPAGSFGMGGRLTPESVSPWIWETPVGSGCHTSASLQADGAGATVYPVVLRCARGGASGGRLILSGIELGDIVPTVPEDSVLLKQWAAEWVKP